MAGGGSNSILWGSKPRTALQSVLRRVHCPPYLLQKSVTHDAQTLNIGFAFFFSTQMKNKAKDEVWSPKGFPNLVPFFARFAT
ncbi:hypothetical protein [Neglectibacter timonensis]|uniref:hypothetical protein n=1 Tax=Neglectibacter timonensis TaxID=1776382 RepID=UPI0023F09C45|nr:hypothetical protein [Neglectibacter timonensis]MEE0730579.1 hypothetical protein [Oscillospiraceae bacterium]